MDRNKFLEPTCWAIWGLVVGGASLWVVVGSVGFFSKSGWLPSDTSGWAQAFGSIAAIAGAYQIGNIQHKRQLAQSEKEVALKKEETKTLMLRLSQNTFFQLGFLHHALQTSMKDFGNPSLIIYAVEGHDLRWPHLMEALQGMDVRDLNGIQTMLLMDLKVGCSFAMRVCEHLDDWNSLSEREALLTMQVEFHKTRAETAYKLFTPIEA